VSTAALAKLKLSAPALPLRFAVTEAFTLKVSPAVPVLTTSMLLKPPLIGFGVPVVVPLAPLAPAAFRSTVSAVV
jgi:hypothetical protein